MKWYRLYFELLSLSWTSSFARACKSRGFLSCQRCPFVSVIIDCRPWKLGLAVLELDFSLRVTPMAPTPCAITHQNMGHGKARDNKNMFISNLGNSSEDGINDLEGMWESPGSGWNHPPTQVALPANIPNHLWFHPCKIFKPYSWRVSRMIMGTSIWLRRLQSQYNAEDIWMVQANSEFRIYSHSLKGPNLHGLVFNLDGCHIKCKSIKVPSAWKISNVLCIISCIYECSASRHVFYLNGTWHPSQAMVDV